MPGSTYLIQVTNRWSEGPELLHARKSHCCGISSSSSSRSTTSSVEGEAAVYLYVAGGTDEKRPVLEAERIRIDQGIGWESQVSQKVDAH